MLKSYVLGKSMLLCRSIATTEEQIEPAVAPKSELRSLDDKMEQILTYKERATSVADFESFLGLLDEVIATCGLSPAEDTTEVASILNRIRVDAGMLPF